MKKLTRIMLVLTVAIICSFVFPNKGIAADNTADTAYDIKVDEPLNVEYDSDTNDYQKWFKFTAPKTKTYEFEVPEPYIDEEFGDGLHLILVFNAPVDFDIHSGEIPVKQLVGGGYSSGDECIAYSECTAGKTYYFVVYNFMEGEDSNLNVRINNHSHVWEKFFAYTKEADYCCEKCALEIITGLSRRSYTYDGKRHKPGINVYTQYAREIPSSDYIVTYPTGRKNVGSYAVKISFKGELKELKPLSRTFKINPKGTYIRKLSRASKGFIVRWAKQSARMSTSRINGYKIRYSRYPSMKNAKTVTVKGYRSTCRKITKLSKNKTYYVQVRTYKVVKAKTYYSKWSTKKSVKTR